MKRKHASLSSQDTSVAAAAAANGSAPAQTQKPQGGKASKKFKKQQQDEKQRPAAAAASAATETPKKTQKDKFGTLTKGKHLWSYKFNPRPEDADDDELPDGIKMLSADPIELENSDDEGDAQMHKKESESEEDEFYFLDSFIHPLNRKEFMQEIFAKKAFATSGAPPARVLHIIENYLYGLDLEMMLEHTSSERIHIWLKEKESAEHVVNEFKVAPKIDSFQVDDPKAALVCYKSGGSLYFRAPQELEQDFVTAALRSCGINFHGIWPDGSNRGEIETFVTRAGHTTTWHTDFQHNFTFHLAGVKKWRFKQGPLHPLRGMTPHFKKWENIESQLKTGQLLEPNFRMPTEEEFQDYEEVEVHPGDVLFFPAGMWHQVECLEDSVQINVSLVGSNWSDVFVDGLRQMLWQQNSGKWREVPTNIHTVADARKQFGELLEQFKKSVNALKVEDFVPGSTILPRQVRFDMSQDLDELVAGLDKTGLVKIDGNTRFRRNPLAMLVTYDRSDPKFEYPSDTDSEGEEDECCGEEGCSHDHGHGHHGHHDDEEHSEDDSEDDDDDDEMMEQEEAQLMMPKYLLHINFGNEEVESLIRITFHSIVEELVPAFEYLRKQRGNFTTQDVVKALNQYGDQAAEKAQALLQLMQFNGLISLSQ